MGTVPLTTGGLAGCEQVEWCGCVSLIGCVWQRRLTSHSVLVVNAVPVDLEEHLIIKVEEGEATPWEPGPLSNPAAQAQWGPPAVLML